MNYKDRFNKAMTSKDSTYHQRLILRACDNMYAEEAVLMLEEALNLMRLKEHEVETFNEMVGVRG